VSDNILKKRMKCKNTWVGLEVDYIPPLLPDRWASSQWDIKGWIIDHKWYPWLGYYLCVRSRESEG